MNNNDSMFLLTFRKSGFWKHTKLVAMHQHPNAMIETRPHLVP